MELDLVRFTLVQEGKNTFHSQSVIPAHAGIQVGAGMAILFKVSWIPANSMPE